MKNFPLVFLAFSALFAGHIHAVFLPPAIAAHPPRVGAVFVPLAVLVPLAFPHAVLPSQQLTAGASKVIAGLILQHSLCRYGTRTVITPSQSIWDTINYFT